MQGAQAQTASLGNAAELGTLAKRTAPRRNKNVAFFSQDISDVSTIKRAHQLIAHGFTVTVLGFRRDRYNLEYKPSWPYVLLGYTEDGRYLRRLRALFAALPAIWADRLALMHTSVFYARNLDQLVLALIVRLAINPSATIIYEVLDIPPILTRRTAGSWLLRKIERFCLHRARYLVLSSPGFFRHYYRAIQGRQGAWLLVENKLPEPLAAPRPQPSAKGVERHNRWVVGYFGLIRGKETFDLITRLAVRLRGKVEFRFRGALTTVGEASFRAALAEHENISFGGPFDNPADLADLYGSVDFAWGLDLENVEHNSRWLLPCRLYEAGYFGVPCLAVRGFELGNVVERQNIGWAFDAPFEDELVRFFEQLSAEDYEAKRQKLLSMPDSAFVASTDIDALCRVVADPEWAFTPEKTRPAAVLTPVSAASAMPAVIDATAAMREPIHP